MRLWRSIKNHLFPYHGNAHRPHVLRRQWLVALLGLAFISEAIILGSTLVIQGPQVFLAAVLRSDVISYTAQARTQEGEGALVENELLDAAAQAKANDMAARGYFSHTGPDGEAPWVWVVRAGYDYVFAGENLAVRFEDSKDVVDAWMASPTHRANIVKSQYQEIGVGIAEGTYKGGPATFVVQFFASPAVARAAAPEVSTLPAAEEVVAGAQTSPATSQQAVVAPEVAQTPSAPTQVSKPPAPPGPTLHAVETALSQSRTGASWALVFVAVLLAVVLALTFFIRIQVQPTDLLLPGAAVALIALAFMGANAKFLPSSQSASVGRALGGDIGQAASVERVRVTFPETQTI